MNVVKFAKLAHDGIRDAIRAAKSRPSTLFEQVFYDIREKAKTIKEGWEQQVSKTIEGQLLKDLSSKGVAVEDYKMSLGKYRGSRFVTSFKLKVRVKGGEKEAERLAEYLRGKYSPKWKVKKVTDGVAELNVR